ncbi:MAG: hypothetical protein SFU53_09570 [Terrimicrobiaceae bacterium]|nr:hypothetical protein [Terrimicrobiaceae bacterium]
MTLHTYLPGQTIPGFDAALLSQHSADLHLRSEDGRSGCSLWWTNTPAVEGGKPGIIGHFSAETPKIAAALLDAATAELGQRGCRVMIGPMDGTTWRRYRVLTERGPEPPFFLEPDNPDWWKKVFEDAGFSPLATYTSSLVEDLEKTDPRADRAWDRLQGEGLVIRSLDPEAFEEDLRRIYDVSVISFTGNFLYTPISWESFLAQYLPYRDKIRPEFVLLAMDGEKTAGYLFAIPDYAEPLGGRPLRTLIGKTLAVLPGRRYGGLGVVLAGDLHRRAKAAGFPRVIHALQHESNKSRNMSDFFGKVMRRYTLYSKNLL